MDEWCLVRVLTVGGWYGFRVPAVRPYVFRFSATTYNIWFLSRGWERLLPPIAPSGSY